MQITARDKLFFSLRAAEQACDVSRRTLRQWIKENRLPAFRVGNKLLVRKADLEAALTAAPVAAGTDIVKIVGECLAAVRGVKA